MADVFISYSKADRDLALKLSALLESYGYTTWWDTSLEPADKYRDKIMGELDAARAVISIWTENSVTSDWVRAEAGRAKGQNKLIPVKASGVEYDAIPLPFGEMHTEPLDNEEAVLGAVKELLERPQEKPSWWRMSWAGVRYEALAWFGIIGAVLTLSASLNSIITLSKLAYLWIDNWVKIVKAFWSTLLFLPELSQDVALLMSVALFFACTVIGSTVKREGNTINSLSMDSCLWCLVLFMPILHLLSKSVITEISEYEPVAPPATLVENGGGMYFVEVVGVDTAFLLFFSAAVGGAILAYLLVFARKLKLSIEKLSQRFLRINIGVALIIALNYFSLWIEPHCAEGGALHRLCGS